MKLDQHLRIAETEQRRWENIFLSVTASNSGSARALLTLFICFAIVLCGFTATAEDAQCSTSGKKMDAFAALQFDLDLPGKATVYLHTAKPLHMYEACEVKLHLPEDAPDDVQVLAFTKDWDYFWYQIILPGSLKPGKTNSFRISYSPDERGWEPKGHQGVWNLRSTMFPGDLGFALLSKKEFKGAASVLSTVMIPRKEESTPPKISAVRANRAALPCYEKFEVTFKLPDRYPDPFDSSEILVYAEFTEPDGSETRVDAFYTQDYTREEDVAETRISPKGSPYWCIRFAPVKQGRHSYSIIAEDRNGNTRWGPGAFTAGKPVKPGFVRVSRQDPRFFEFDNRDSFNPIGHNIRSPFDTRMDRNFPFKHRWQEGSSSYSRRFTQMHNSGQNIAEIWFAAWSLGLEWNEKWFGYHGTGQYNLIHASEMDQVIEDADKNDIYLNLVIHNHGKFSTFSDEEWNDNPFNVRNGGWLKEPSEFFSDKRAIREYLKLMRYKIARWGYSTRVFAWELWSELDLTGSAENRGMHKREETVQWHAFISQALKEMDPNDHLISAHVCGDYSHQNPDLISLPGIDLCPVDAYHGSSNPLHIVGLIQNTARYNNPYKKPVLITEFGGSSSGGSTDYLKATLHAALWTSTCVPVSGTPLFWWWGLIEEENYYPLYKAVSNFMKGEDRRDEDAKTESPPVILGGKQSEDFTALSFHGKHHGLGWLYHRDKHRHMDLPDAAGVNGLSCTLNDFAEGSYDVEYWDTVKGEITMLTKVKSDGGRITLEFPELHRDIAFKIKHTNLK